MTTPSITGFTEFEIAQIFKSLTGMADDFMRIGMAPIARDHCTLAAKVRAAYAAEHASMAEAHGLAEWLRHHSTHIIKHNPRGFLCTTCTDEWIVSEAWTVAQIDDTLTATEANRRAEANEREAQSRTLVTRLFECRNELDKCRAQVHSLNMTVAACIDERHENLERIRVSQECLACAHNRRIADTFQSDLDSILRALGILEGALPLHEVVEREVLPKIARLMRAGASSGESPAEQPKSTLKWGVNGIGGIYVDAHGKAQDALRRVRDRAQSIIDIAKNGLAE